MKIAAWINCDMSEIHDIVSGALEICVNPDHRGVADVTQLQEMVEYLHSNSQIFANLLNKLNIDLPQG